MDLFDSPTFHCRVNELASRYHVPGISLAAAKEGKVVSAAFGLASRQSKQPCTAATLFDIASCSKSFTAAAVAMLVADAENTHVLWTTPVADLLPEDFVMPMPEVTKEVTVEDLLSHRTGLGR